MLTNPCSERVGIPASHRRYSITEPSQPPSSPSICSDVVAIAGNVFR